MVKKPPFGFYLSFEKYKDILMTKTTIVNLDNITCILYARPETGRTVSLPLETLDRAASYISNSY